MLSSLLRNSSSISWGVLCCKSGPFYAFFCFVCLEEGELGGGGGEKGIATGDNTEAVVNADEDEG